MPVRVFTEEEKKVIQEKMFEAGFTLIKQNGLTHTSVEKITDFAGIGKSTFYNFYPSKEDFVIDLISYERNKAMQMIKEKLNDRPKLTVEESKNLIRMIIYSQDSIYQYLNEEDIQKLYPAMQKKGMIKSDLDSDVPAYLLSIFDGVSPDTDPRVFLNYIRIMALAVSQKDALRQDVLEETLELMFDKLFLYLFVE
ncbi:MAG: TetR/AcrR family transcriptional regulator [Treponemataceae bacterium]|nr:TetR/AcrR family transcriptional regulator [Treponemataceae bacterium]